MYGNAVWNKRDMAGRRSRFVMVCDKWNLGSECVAGKFSKYAADKCYIHGKRKPYSYGFRGGEAAIHNH